jgi:Conserved hypothetical protein (DUF2461)
VPEIDCESLQRPPAGFDPRHPFIDDLNCEGCSVGLPFQEVEVRSPGLPDRLARAGRTLPPLNRFLTAELGVEH